MTEISQARILIMATNGFEQSELVVPRDRLRQAGATVEVAPPEGRDIRGCDEKDGGDSVPSDLRIGKAQVDRYGARSSCRAARSTRTSCAPTRVP